VRRIRVAAVAALQDEGLQRGVVKLCETDAVGPPPMPLTPSIVTVYEVSSHSGCVKRMPTLRPDVSTVNGAAGETVTWSA
jgi:hypothetical protein